MSAPEMLKPTEAAVVSSVPVRDVNRVIDENILPAGLFEIEGGRRIVPAACSLISFYFGSADRLTAEERRSTIDEAGERFRKQLSRPLKSLLKEDWIVRHDFLTIDLAPFVKGAAERMDRLAAACEIALSDPEIMGGWRCIRGTRIPIHDIGIMAANGVPVEEILEDYPSLDAEKVELARIYAEANPPRGRPSWIRLPEGTVLVESKTIPFRGEAE